MPKRYGISGPTVFWEGFKAGCPGSRKLAPNRFPKKPNFGLAGSILRHVESSQRNRLDKILHIYYPHGKFENMTKFADSLVAAALDAERLEAEAQAEREIARGELDGMSRAMVEEEGLLNHVQAALLLGVSVKRIGELVRLGKLRRFDFLGRTYVSVREVRERYRQELKAGRPKRGLMESAVASVKAALKTDAAQARLGGYAGPHEKAKRKGKAK
jgi:hypothetical protein